MRAKPAYPGATVWEGTDAKEEKLLRNTWAARCAAKRRKNVELISKTWLRFGGWQAEWLRVTLALCYSGNPLPGSTGYFHPQQGVAFAIVRNVGLVDIQILDLTALVPDVAKRDALINGDQEAFYETK